MSYNQKVWLGILVLCSFFWLAVIGGIFSVHEAYEHTNLHGQEDFTTRYSQHYHGTEAPSHNLQARSPTS